MRRGAPAIQIQIFIVHLTNKYIHMTNTSLKYTHPFLRHHGIIPTIFNVALMLYQCINTIYFEGFHEIISHLSCILLMYY